MIWSYDPHFDVAFDTDDLATLAAPARELVCKYSYFDTAIGSFILCGDDARFMNHSDSPNTAEVTGPGTIAAREIAPGEELTCNYAELGLSTFA